MIDSNKEKDGLAFERFLPRSQSKAAFIFSVLCYSLVLTEIGARLTTLAGLWPAAPDSDGAFSRYIRPGVDDSNLVEFLVFAPILESFTMIGAIELLRVLRIGVPIQLIVSVLLIFLLHAYEYLFWAVILIPAFVLNAYTYLYWRRGSFWVGATMMVSLHFLFNCFPAMTVLSERLGR